MESLKSYLRKIAVKALIAWTINSVCSYIFLTTVDVSIVPQIVFYGFLVILAVIDLFIVFRFADGAGDAKLFGGVIFALAIILSFALDTKNIPIRSIVFGMMALGGSGLLVKNKEVPPETQADANGAQSAASNATGQTDSNQNKQDDPNFPA